MSFKQPFTKKRQDIHGESDGERRREKNNGESALRRLRDLQYIFAVTSGSPSMLHFPGNSDFNGLYLNIV